jgi:hypothetical protein
LFFTVIIVFPHTKPFLLLANYYPPVARGPQWSKSRPGGPVVKFAPTVTVTLGDTLPTIHACLGDRVVICNISKNRVYILGSDDLPNNFHSGILQPVSGHCALCHQGEIRVHLVRLWQGWQLHIL